MPLFCKQHAADAAVASTVMSDKEDVNPSLVVAAQVVVQNVIVAWGLGAIQSFAFQGLLFENVVDLKLALLFRSLV